MIDNEIVKALECCMGCACTECPYYRETDIDAENCMGRLIIEALKLVNRQKAEIDRLKKLHELSSWDLPPMGGFHDDGF